MIVTVHAAICPNKQIYAKVTKITKKWASEESFKILSGDRELYLSPSLADDSERVLEICLDSSTNNQYILQMDDSGGDSWSDGAWISIEGVNGNIVLKQMMTSASSERYQFSLYSPINKGDEWKYSDTITPSWTKLSYDDRKWTRIMTGNTAQQAIGTQYFRHFFTGFTDFAAMEVQLNYQYGIIAYLNGAEFYRDNMPKGTVTSSTPSSGAYPEIGYHGVVRSADLVTDLENILAVELHFPRSNYTEIIQFNGFLSLLAEMREKSRCCVLPYDPVITSHDFTMAEKAWDWTRNSKATTSTPGASMTADFSAMAVRSYVNGVRVWPHTSTTSTISTFILSGAQNPSEPFTEIFTIQKAVYQPNEWKEWTRVTPSEQYNYVRLTAKSAQTTPMDLYEVQFMVCNLPIPTHIIFQQKYGYFRDYEPVDIHPKQQGFTNCMLNDTLPAGLVWNSASCSLSGIATEKQLKKTYVVTTKVGTTEITGTFDLLIWVCEDDLYRIVRTYKTAPQNEYLRVYTISTMEVIFEVAMGHSHPENTNWSEFICGDGSWNDVEITFYHTGNYWAEGSYFYLYYQLPDNEEELVVKGRFDNYEQTITNHYLYRPLIRQNSLWEYKFDSVPANWYNFTTSSTPAWPENSPGNFGKASNKIQLFRKIYLIHSIGVKGLILSLRYKYGCVVYLNGYEVWRNGVTGEVTANPIATNSYPEIKYRVVTLPGRSIPTVTQPVAIDYLKQGVNTIAIALVAEEDSQTTVDFACVIRPMRDFQSESHIWEFESGSTSGLSGSYTDPFSQYHGRSIYQESEEPCTTNSLQFKLANDRREWVSSVHIQSSYLPSDHFRTPTQFKLFARNGDNEEWTLLKEVIDLTWSVPGQTRKIYFQNNMPYNQFKFEDLFPDDHTTQCNWRVQSLGLYIDNPLREVEPLSYGATTIEVFKDIELAELIPTSDGYYDFHILPDLPNGIALDPQTGWISGTPVENSEPTAYTISASKFTGGTTQVVITLSVEVCLGIRSLMTVRFRADSYPSENSWTLYQGRGTHGNVLQQIETFPVASNYYYVDFCLLNSIYTFEGQDSFGDGWQYNTGYTLTVDMGAMEIEIQELPEGKKPLTVTTVFSTYFPFQFDITEWRINQEGWMEEWNTIDFDDSAWLTRMAAEIPPTEKVTTYIRKTFTLTNIADYQVLNVRIKYSGGVACYFNGNMVGLINMKEGFDETTPSIEEHDPSLNAKFHFILPTSGMVEGRNVIAFEVHRPKGATAVEAVVFDATGVFGVEDCSVVVDSYAWIESTELLEGTVENIMDLDPFTTGTLPNAVDSYMQWTVDNRLGSKWNQFNLYLAGPVTSWGFILYGISNPEMDQSERMLLFQQSDMNMEGRTRPNLSIPLAIRGFRQYRWEMLDTASANYGLNSMFMTYCKGNGAVCPAIDDYPSVVEGQISPSSCPEGYEGYTYRNCMDGVLGEVHFEYCRLKIPKNAHYSQTSYEFVKSTRVSTGTPNVENIVTRWYLDSTMELPKGLVLNEINGEITGVPEECKEKQSYTIYAENESGAVSTVVTISVRVGHCKSEGVFPTTEIDQLAVYECSTREWYYGTMKRMCLLGKEDGEWQSIQGLCISSSLILTILVIIIAVIIIVFKAKDKMKEKAGNEGKKKRDGRRTKSLKWKV